MGTCQVHGTPSTSAKFPLVTVHQTYSMYYYLCLLARKKSKFKFLKTRLFSRLKRKETEGQIKQSQSSSDVTTHHGGKGEDDSEDDSHYQHKTLSSRALSHDSIFLANEVQSSQSERVLSQENVHSKIRALQLKLQQQNMRLGPPPLLIPAKRIEESGTTSEDDGLPCSPPEMYLQDVAVHTTAYKFPDTKKHLSSLSLAGTGSEEEEQVMLHHVKFSRLSPQAFISSPIDLASSSSSVDFNSPAQYVPCLDNSAARHRMSIKPRNQRASSKAKKPPSVRVCMHRTGLKTAYKHINTQIMITLRYGLAICYLFVKRKHHSMISADTINLYSAQVTSLEDELTSVSLPANMSLQDKQEKTMALESGPVGPPSIDDEALKASDPIGPPSMNDEALKPSDSVGPPSMDNQAQKTSDPFPPEGRVTTNPLYLQPMPGLFPPLNADSQHTKETAVDCNEAYKTSPVKVLAADYYVTTQKSSESVEAGTTEQMHTLKKAVDADALRVAETLARPRPVPAPRTKKPTLENRNMSALKINISKYREFEKEAFLPELICRNTLPFGGLDESSKKDNEPQRLNSFQFSTASVKNRSKMSGEHVSKKEDESSCDETSLKPPSYNPNLEAQMEKTHNVKPIEVNKTSFAITLLKEVILQNVSKTEVERNPELCEGCAQTIEAEKSKKVEENEEKKNLFGVKLRTTSLSLKYRSDVAKAEAKIKRHSLEENHMIGVSDGHTGKEPSSMDMTDITNARNVNVLTNLALQNPDLQQDTTLDKGNT
uniref:Cracd like b n=1 Tax=Electrophorus electricus TaxID=8005 RepID=A0A4W4GZM0_ELEEL